MTGRVAYCRTKDRNRERIVFLLLIKKLDLNTRVGYAEPVGLRELIEPVLY